MSHRGIEILTSFTFVLFLESHISKDWTYHHSYRFSANVWRWSINKCFRPIEGELMVQKVAYYYVVQKDTVRNVSQLLVYYFLNSSDRWWSTTRVYTNVRSQAHRTEFFRPARYLPISSPWLGLICHACVLPFFYSSRLT